jgi:hypothetical protein
VSLKCLAHPAVADLVTVTTWGPEDQCSDVVTAAAVLLLLLLLLLLVGRAGTAEG